VEQDYSNGALDDVVYSFTNVSGRERLRLSGDRQRERRRPARDVRQQQWLAHDHRSGEQQTLTSIADDTMTGGGSGATFVFNPIYGHDTITDFSNFDTGANHDTISFASSEGPWLASR